LRIPFSEPANVPCPYCGSSHIVIRKGIRYNKDGPKQIFLCKTRNRRFSEHKVITKLREDTLEKYLTEAGSLDFWANELGVSITTLYRRLREESRECPGWPELLKKGKRPEKWGSVLGIDTTGLKIRRDHWVYLHVADVTSGHPLAYENCEREDVATIEPVLRQLRDFGYNPEFAVCDLAPELLNAIRIVFPLAKIQGCVFHLALSLDKKLPTRNTIRDVGKEKVVLWRKVKGLIMCAAISKNQVTRQQYLEQLRGLDLDQTAKSVVWRFLSNLKYYHALDQLKDYGKSILYNNLCECHIGMVKTLKRKMRSFKSIDAARDFIKSYWFFYRRNLKPLPEKNEDAMPHNMPLFSFHDSVNLAELSNSSGIPRELLNREMQKMGHEVVGDYTFTESALKDIQKRIFRIKKTSLRKVMDETGFDEGTVVQLLRKFGFTILYKSLDPSDIEISSIGHE
jgi:transposase-like protein